MSDFGLIFAVFVAVLVAVDIGPESPSNEPLDRLANANTLALIWYVNIVV